MDELISRKDVTERMKGRAGCEKCENYGGVRCRACTWDDAMDCVDEVPAVPAVPLDKLCEWLARNYEPVYNIDDIHNLTWPIDYSQQKEAWMKILKKLMKED